MSAGTRILLTDEEKAIVKRLGHNLYTVDFLEEWINRKDNVYTNAPAALQACTACGFYQAIKAMAQNKYGRAMAAKHIAARHGHIRESIAYFVQSTGVWCRIKSWLLYHA